MDYDSEGAPGAVRVVMVTVPDQEAGRRLAATVVEERLAACGNVIPGLISVYRWAGEIQEDAEALVIFKTTSGAIQSLMKRVTELHPYDVPEFLALPVTKGHPPYLQWVIGEVAEPE